MSLSDLKSLYSASIVILSLIILAPTLIMVVSVPQGEQFSELYLLGSSHIAESYPFNVSQNKTYRVYLGIGNHIGSLGYFKIYAKFRNQTESLPNSTTPSYLPQIFEYCVFLASSSVYETEVAFSFEDVSLEGGLCRVSRFAVDDREISVTEATTWDQQNHGFYFQLFFELWIYNTTVSQFQYDKKFVGIWLNVTHIV